MKFLHLIVGSSALVGSVLSGNPCPNCYVFCSCADNGSSTSTSGDLCIKSVLPSSLQKPYVLYNEDLEGDVHFYDTLPKNLVLNTNQVLVHSINNDGIYTVLVSKGPDVSSNLPLSIKNETPCK
ncbi:uncharacterized protein KGF55_002021 [Candida pseudojiufengensis]|uniref:uncharacterized protein n=1 Tax=Candida pseudojiufengensis TaxID=497109 RepID=UPI00222486A9|nr:uncharacterized protein KGF55_002021 [Candida pseudojiufengensis]KAI5964079.1 hypothetical protein KGF55_002021 [Candida pseudojiufengensis]